jgi:hypothetical protein
MPTIPDKIEIGIEANELLSEKSCRHNITIFPLSTLDSHAPDLFPFILAFESRDSLTMESELRIDLVYLGDVSSQIVRTLSDPWIREAAFDKMLQKKLSISSYNFAF